DDLWSNVLTFLKGCPFGVAVFEQSDTRDYNPNVALEVGHMIALEKPVCILKERSVPSVPTDLLHRLYIEYDHFDLPGILQDRLPRWLRDNNPALSGCCIRLILGSLASERLPHGKYGLHSAFWGGVSSVPADVFDTATGARAAPTAAVGRR